MTEKDRKDIKEIVTEAVDSLKELFIEKLNGHADAAERNAKQINELYSLDRLRVGEIAQIRADVGRLEERIDANAKVSTVEESLRDKKELAVDAAVGAVSQRKQFSITTWVAIACAVLGPIIVALIMGAGQ